MSEIGMPRLSDSMEEGTILEWLKQDGDEVRRGEAIAEIETDKATMTFEADADGVLEIIAEQGATLPVGEPIARIGSGADSNGAGSDGADAEASDAEAADAEASDAEASDAEASDAREDEDGGGEEAAAGDDGDGDGDGDAAARRAGADAERDGGERAPAPSSSAGNGGERVLASPVARRVARELGVGLEGIDGTGPGGRIVKADVEARAQKTERAGEEDGAPAREPARAREPRSGRGEKTVEELSRTQALIARRMAESRATVPDFTLDVEIDMEAAVRARADLADVTAIDGSTPSLNDLVVKAAAIALREHPRANGSYRDGRFELHERVNVGIAVAADDSLVVPTIFDADTKSLGAIGREARSLARRVRERSITPPELSGGTFTVSNLGMYGIDRFTAIINPPQAAILSVGTVEQRPVVRDGELVARHTMRATLACDHRILYGAPAAEFLARIRMLLERPLSLAL